MEDPFYIIEPPGQKSPFILSVPHCGTEFPAELKANYLPDMIAAPDDTDWYVHKLYEFASELGITIIHARYSRWVIDLNRDPQSKPLYDDGRIITALCPTSDFFGKPIYISKELEPDETEIERRLQRYYFPYYEKIETLLQERKKDFGKVILWDAHSIRHYVPTIRKEVFPDMILGDNDEKTAHTSLIAEALNTLRSDKYGINHNDPFKGGYITRHFGNPKEHTHALQLEMNKILYMDDDEKNYHPNRAEAMQLVLRRTFTNLLNTLGTL